MKIKLSWKLALIGISSTVPLLCGTFYLINKYTNKDIGTAVLEQQGNRCLRPLVSLLETLPQHQALALRNGAGDPAAAGQMAACRERITRALDDLEKLGGNAGFGNRVPDTAGQVRAPVQSSELRREWLELVRQLPQATSQDTVVRHTQLMAGVRALITHIGNASNLILDPDLDSYYLMDVTLVVLPQTLDRLARTLALGDELIRQPSLGANSRTQLAVQANQLKESDLNRLSRDTQTALTADADYHGVSASLQRALPPVVKGQAEAMEAFVTLLTRMAESGQPVVSAADFEAAGTRVRQRSMELWEVGAVELDHLLQRRIDDLNRTRAWGLGLVALTLALTVGVTIGVARRINRVEQTLLASEQRHRHMLDSMMEGCQIIGFDWRYLYLNDAAARFGKRKKEELLGRTVMECYPGFDRTPMFASLRRCMEERTTAFIEEEFFHADGTKGWYALGIQPAREGIFVLSLDITGRKAVEAERERSTLREQAARKEYTRKLIASQEVERRRIASGLHDSLGQNLLLVKNRALLALAQKNLPAEVSQQVQSMADLATQAITEVRQISHDLRPYQLDQLGLTRALQAMIDSAAQSTALQFKSKLEPVDDVFPAAAAIEVYRVVQESLNNVMKHSGARQVRLELERDLHQVRLWIEDDGRGFAHPGSAAGFGLQNMAERVGLLGGKFSIDSAPGTGTRIEVIFPLQGSV